MLTLFLEQLGFQFNLELLGPTVLQVIASSKESFFFFIIHSCNLGRPWKVWAESLKASSLIFSVPAVARTIRVL